MVSSADFRWAENTRQPQKSLHVLVRDASSRAEFVEKQLNTHYNNRCGQFPATLSGKEYLESEREGIALINKGLKLKFSKHGIALLLEVINITIDPHRSFLAMADIAKGFALVVSAIHLFHQEQHPGRFQLQRQSSCLFSARAGAYHLRTLSISADTSFEFIFPITNRRRLYHNSQYPIVPNKLPTPKLMT